VNRFCTSSAICIVAFDVVSCASLGAVHAVWSQGGPNLEAAQVGLSVVAWHGPIPSLEVCGALTLGSRELER